MTRSELRAIFRSIATWTKSAIENAPLRAFLVGILLGALLVLMKSYLYTLIVLLFIVVAGLWLFAKENGSIGDDSTSVRRAPDQAS